MRHRRWPKALLIVVIAAVVVVIVARLLAPTIVRQAVNRRLSQIPGYSGHVEQIHLRLWRGAYEIEGLKIVKSSGKVREPFFSAKHIDFSLAWRELFHRKFVSDIYAQDVHLVFQKGKTEETSQLSTDRRWQDVIHDIFPIDITHLEISGGTIRFIDATRDPNVNIAVQNIEVIATGLRNRPAEDGKEYPAKIDVSGESIGGGQLRLFSKLDPLAAQAHFELNVELTKVALPALNDFLNAYAGVEVSQGRFEVFGQLAVQKGHYEGYIKPFLDHVDFSSPNPKDEGLGKLIWEGLVSAVAELFKNSKTKQIATRIPFSGDAKTFDVGTLRAIANGLHQGFIKALPHGFEGTTHPDDKTSTLPPVSPASGTQASKTPAK